MGRIYQQYLIAVAVLTLALPSCSHSPASRVNLVLISIDTLRSDHLGCYGYDRETSPSIDTIASAGVLFSDVVSQSPWTLPSHATMLTSTSPPFHRLVREGKVLNPRINTLAEILRARGYTTAAFTGGGYMNHRFGMDQGFGLYMDSYGEETASSTTLDIHLSDFRGLVFDWLAEHADDPFFLFIHCYDVHKPYDPPRELVEPFFPACGGEVITFLHNSVVIFEENGKQPLKVPVRQLTSSQKEHVIAHYDGEIREVDEEIGDLVETLGRLGILDKTLLVITSDHGEAFFEHGAIGHRRSLFQEELRVPLIMRLEGVITPGTRLGVPGGIIDIAPTILDLLHVPHEEMAGKNLLDPAGVSGANEPIFSVYLEQKLAALRKGRYKLIASGSNGMFRLVDLEADPFETTDISRQLPALRSDMIRELGAWMRSQKAAGESFHALPALLMRDSLGIEQLKALGYIEEKQIPGSGEQEQGESNRKE